MASKEDRRIQILSAAREEFAKRGYHATKIDDIVAAAKIARGTFYLYFTDKRSIFEELVDRFSARLGMSILRVDTQDPSRTVEAQVRENIRRVLNVFLEDRMMAKIFVADAVGVDPAFDAKLASFNDEVAKLFMESLREGQRLALVRDGDVRLFAYFTMGGITEVLYQIVTRHLDYGVDGLVESIFQILRQGYLTPPIPRDDVLPRTPLPPVVERVEKPSSRPKAKKR
jgi:AcrR family transcriptional regulator